MQNSAITNPLLNDERAGLPSASYWHRYELCSASHQLTLTAKRLGKVAWTDDAAAAKGNRIHTLIEGKPVPDMTDNEMYIAQGYNDKSQSEIERIFGDAPVVVTHEQRFWLRRGGVAVASGRADLIAISGKTALIQDFKTGFTKPVDADENAQLRFLAVGLALEHPELEEIVGQIISPYGISEVRFGVEGLADAWESIMATLEAINDPMAQAVPSIDACRYCPAILVCDAARAKSWKIARYQIADLPTGEKAGQILDECELVDRLIAAVKEYYYKQIEEGAVIPNWSLVPGRSVRELTSAKEAGEKLLPVIGQDALNELVSYSIPELEKAVADQLKLKKKQATEKLTEVLGDTLTTKQNKPVLKRTKELTRELSV